MGHAMPNSVAAMRGMKAEGGWAVVATEECDIHASSDVLPHPEARLWDKEDQRRLALMVDAVHAHGALAAVELCHNGHSASNRYSRLPVMGVSDLPVASLDPVQAYAMSKRDIASVRRWHRAAALRAKEIGFDIVYVYAGHDLALPMHFLSRRWNHRSDEYGGSLENRVRLTRELLEDTCEAVGDVCGVAFRLAVDELIGDEGICSDSEGREIVEMLSELPDLWDVNVSDWPNDSATSRFGGEGAQEPYVSFVKQLTSKPVVGVGRFTSPDAMVSQIQRGVLDFIGAARPSIADPFLPRKIEEGRPEDIRECIGCNICVSGDWTHSPIRCTQNPTMAEEWRRGWHPETMNPKGASSRVLVVGGGPAGAASAIYTARKGFRTGIAAERFGGQLHDTLGIENLPGTAYTEGPKLAADLERQVGENTIDLMNLAKAVKLVPAREEGGLHTVEFGNGAKLKTRSLILSTGARWRNLGVPGEAEYRNKGVAYCPHCDGPLFKGKRVAVIGGGNSGVEAAIDLAGIVSHVTLLEFADSLRADAVLQKKLYSLPNVSVIKSAQTTEVIGDGQKVTGLTYKDRTTDALHTVELEGIFVQIGLLPNSDWLKGTVELSRFGEIIVDAKGQTSVAGVFAAGDVADSVYRQAITSAGAGCMAALDVERYLDGL